MEHIMIGLTAIGLLGIGAQWLAWRMNLPAIVLMAVAGLIVGPVLGWLNPEGLLGEFYQPAISVAVAIILFEGGLQLNFKEIKGTISKGVWRLVIPGVPIAWGLGAAAAHYAAGLSWSVSILFAGILIVTGPTVIMPLLRQARLAHRPSALLKWEGIVNDPIGALLAVVVYEYMTFETSHHTTWQVAGSLAIGSILAVLWGVLIGRLTAVSFIKGWVPEYLKPPVLLMLVLFCFVCSNLVQEEAGLLAVTAMGITMANAKLPSLGQLRHFKETIAILFVSGVFIMLTASLSMDTIQQALSWKTLAFVTVMLFVVRPISILVSTIGSGLTFQERLLAAWIAPRGIVAVAVSSFFAGALVANGYAEAEQMIPLAFAMSFATVVLHGFTMAPLGKLLGLASKETPGIILVGASDWAVNFAKKLQEIDVPVIIADESWMSLREARNNGVNTYHGEILSEVTEHHVELNAFGFVIALGRNSAHNSLVCTDLAPEFGRASIYQISASAGDGKVTREVPITLTGRRFMRSAPTLYQLQQRQAAGWRFQKTKITKEYPYEAFLENLGEGEVVVALRKGNVVICGTDHPITPTEGDVIVYYCPPVEAAEK